MKSKSNVVDEIRRVTVGPVACQLSKRRKVSRFFPRLLLAMATMGCGFMVKTALNNSQIWAANPYDGKVWTAAPIVPEIKRLDAGRDAQVRTVVELVGAFQDVVHKKNPLELLEVEESSPEKPSTAPVAFYSVPQYSKGETNRFFKKIHLYGDVEGHQFEVTQVAHETVANLTPVLSQVGSGFMNSQDSDSLNFLPENVAGVSNAPNPMAADIRETAEPLSQFVTLAPPALPSATESEVESPVVNADSTVAQPIPTDQPADLVPVERRQLESANDASMSDTSMELRRAIAGYDEAWAKFASSESPAKAISRDYYRSLAELGRVAFANHSAEECLLRLRHVHEHPAAQRLAESAAASWLKWAKRDSVGVVVAGVIESVETHNEGLLVELQTADRNSTTIQVFLQDTEFEHESGEKAVFFGIASKDPVIQPVQARLLSPTL